MTDPRWKTGFEIELLAPRGASRRDLAVALASRQNGSVQRIFYPQSEISEVPGMPVFENLTLGFEASDANGNLIARCTDDLTIVADLDRTAPPVPGWYRIVSDDIRFLRLIMAQCDADAVQGAVLEPMAALFGTDLAVADGMVRLGDAMGASVAIAASLPGERERPCELITPPLEVRHGAVLTELLSTARTLGFSVPTEAAVHIHFDAARLRDSGALVRLLRLLDRETDRLRAMVGTNPRCVRLGGIPEALMELVSSPDFGQLPWPDAQARLADLELSKYCDFNILNLVQDTPGKPTFEVRILPGSMDARQILTWTRLFTAILEWALTGETLPGSEAFYAGLDLGADDRRTLGLG